MTNSRASTNHPVLSATMDGGQGVTSSTTLVNVTEMKLSVAANKKYCWKFLLRCKGATAGDLKIKWVIPSGASMKHATALSPATASAEIDAETELVIETTTTYQLLYFVGWITVSSTAGEIQLQMAQNASNGTATQIGGGSNIQIWET